MAFMETLDSTTANNPTTTTITDALFPQDRTVDAVPWAGNIYIIRDSIDGCVITLVDGQLGVVKGLSKMGGWHWLCVERDGWFRFRNTVSGTYIGSNGFGEYLACSSDEKGYGSFIAKKHPDGGYLLMTKHEQGGLQNMTIAKDGWGLVHTNDERTIWEFVKVNVPLPCTGPPLLSRYKVR